MRIRTAAPSVYGGAAVRMMRIQPCTVRLYHALRGGGRRGRIAVNGFGERIERIAVSGFGERIERIVWIGGTTVTV